MKAAWDWHLPRQTIEEQAALVAFAHELGFDTLIVHAPTPTMMDTAGQLGVKVIAIVTPNATDAFVQQHPDSLQQMQSAEQAIVEAAHTLDWDAYTRQSHRWFPIVQMAPMLCFEHPASRAELKERVSQALAIADGVAFDGFGFQNHYACFCQRCRGMRQSAAKENPAWYEDQVIAHTSEHSLVENSQLLYAHAKSVKPDAIVTNHVWPPFRPNPYYGNRLKLDYCSQTISWFYRPNWSLARVAFEAEQMKQIEDPAVNRFVPFIGMFDDPYLVRSADRLTAELEVALKYGEGHLIFCPLKTPHDYPKIREALRSAMSK